MHSEHRPNNFYYILSKLTHLPIIHGEHPHSKVHFKYNKLHSKSTNLAIIHSKRWKCIRVSIRLVPIYLREQRAVLDRIEFAHYLWIFVIWFRNHFLIAFKVIDNQYWLGQFYSGFFNRYWFIENLMLLVFWDLNLANSLTKNFLPN